MADASQSSETFNANSQIQQGITGDGNQAIGQVYGGIVLYLSGGQAIINSATTDRPTAESSPVTEIASNPYKGLLSFHEEDRDNFFGRSQDIQDLWEQFRDLQTAEVRLLPVYGPSGSGKSSLVRAGLIPELGQRLLPGRDRARVAVLVPGTQPLQALATVLARIAESDLTPVKKAREFAEELELKSKVGDYDGLQRISNTLPDIATFPLIVVIDQFEEIYSYEPQGNNPEDREKRQSFVAEREAFIQNLLYAACDRSQYVSVIITMRSDFLGATQQHPRLNKLFSKSGFLVPVMQPDQLAIAITEPAKRVGYEFNQATVQLLVDFTQEQDAALPLLQFALSKIWEGLHKNVSPEDTLKEIGGVGGALAQETQKLYESLTPEQQKTARSIFLALVQTSDDKKYLRRRAPISELITYHQDEILVGQVINHFARPGVWILVTSANEHQVEMVEVAHEALIRNWKELKDWLKEQWQALLQKRKIEDAAAEWQNKSKSLDYLLQGRPLREAREFMEFCQNNSEISLSSLAAEFVNTSEEKQGVIALKSASVLIEDYAMKWQTEKKSKDLLKGGLLEDSKEIIKLDQENSEISLSNLVIEFVKASIKKQKTHKFILNSSAIITVLIFLAVALFFIDSQKITTAKNMLYPEQKKDECKPDPEIKGLLEYMWWTGRARLKDLKLCKEDLGGIQLPRSVIEASDFREATLSHANFRGAQLLESDFRGAILPFAEFHNSGSKTTILIKAKFQSLDKKRTVLTGAQFQNADLTGAQFQNADLTGAQFQNADVKDVNFQGANLTEANLEGAQDLDEVNQLKDVTLCRTMVNHRLISRNCSIKN